jgi:hypothetical protein
MEPTRTNAVNYISGVYESVCHPMERIVLEGSMFPRCGTCNKETVWTFVRKLPPNPEILPGPVQPQTDI